MLCRGFFFHYDRMRTHDMISTDSLFFGGGTRLQRAHDLILSKPGTISIFLESTHQVFYYQICSAFNAHIRECLL